MLYAVLADIHANLQAIEAVQRDLSRFPGVRVVSAGDTVGYGANPNECVDVIRSIAAVNVLGNHDAAVIGKTDISRFNEYAGRAAMWTMETLTGSSRAYLEGLGFVGGGDELTVVHGTLHLPGEFIYMMTDADAMSTFELLKSPVCFVGHSHLPGVFVLKGGKVYGAYKREFRIEEGERFIVNAGSVGQPRDGDKRACYCLFDTESRRIEFRRVEYDVKGAHDAILEAGLPAPLAERLGRGR